MPQLQFKGKQFVQNHHLAVKYRELIPQKDKSLTDKVSLHDNLIIHGDNLDALKALLPIYGGKVKCIYIDPPYNTGNEGWVYSDNVNSPMIQDWLKTNTPVDNEDLTRHDKWLCMMTPRLKLLRELLREDGVIFVSIDDNEQHHLRMLMDEIFGVENFIANFLWKKKSTSTNVKGSQVSSQVEYILGYSKSAEGRINPRTKLVTEREYPYSDEDGNYRLTIIEKKHAGSYKRESMRFPILGVKPREGKRWQIGEEKARDLESQNRFIIDNEVVKLKIYDFEDKDTFSAQPTLLEKCGSTDSAQRILTDIFGEAEAFDNPKPVELLLHLILIASDKDDIILDSFAGSGTTAHAVLAQDGGNRKFILVEMEDYANKITAERVRRVIKGVPKAKNENLKKGLGGTFSYFELGKPIEMESILEGKNMPNYTNLARYVFYTATGEQFDENKVNKKRNYIGESCDYHVFLFYKPDVEYLKKTALTLDIVNEMNKKRPKDGKRRLVFAPAKYVDEETLRLAQIDFAQLPFEIYRLAK
ncbi:MAG: site-specific DNA-methyltransferase [bacterium]|nr:site-specific DNA-methyltransferase [bacterium]